MCNRVTPNTWLRRVAVLVFFIFVVTFFVKLGKAIPASSAVEQDKGGAAQRILESHGLHRAFFTVTVGSSAATEINPGLVMTSVADDPDNLRGHRVTMTKNPSANFELYIASWAFNPQNDAFDSISESSGTYTTYGHGSFWVRYPPGASSGPVRGQILSR